MKYLTCAVILSMLVSLSGCLQTDAVRYGGQYYPEEWLLKARPDLWGDLEVGHILFSSGTEGNQALLTGSVDINVGSDSKTVALFTASDDIVILATVQRGDRYSTIVRADSPYETWEDLRGKTVATRLGTGAEQVLLRYFDNQSDLDWDDFEWVNLKIEDMIFALESGRIDAFTAWEPTPAIAEAAGIGKVLRSYGDVAIVPVSIHTTKTYAETHREEIVQFLMAHIRKVDLIEQSPDEAARMAAEAAGGQGIEVSPLAFSKIFERVDFSLEFDNEALAALRDTAQFLYEKGKIKEIPEFQWDGSYLEEARKRVRE